MMFSSRSLVNRILFSRISFSVVLLTLSAVIPRASGVSAQFIQPNTYTHENYVKPVQAEHNSHDLLSNKHCLPREGKVIPIGCLDYLKGKGNDSPHKLNLYFNQKPPQLNPEIFAPGLISLADRGEFASVFSADGTEFIFGVSDSKKTEIYSTRLTGQNWSKPKAIVAHKRYSYMDAFLSPDESQLYYISNQPLNGQGEPKDPDLWFSNRTQNGWGTPQNAGPVLNSSQGEYFVSFTSNGTLYFTTNRGATKGHEINFEIHASHNVDGVFQKPVRLSRSVNSMGYDGDVFVAPDESYLIFSSDRPDGYGSGDLYVSFKTAEGTWTDAKNMGARINTDSQDYCPFVTRDGRYLFYSTKRDIYWVDARIIDTFR